MRGLSENFIHCLKSEKGLLLPVLERVKKDDKYNSNRNVPLTERGRLFRSKIWY